MPKSEDVIERLEALGFEQSLPRNWAFTQKIAFEAPGALDGTVSLSAGEKPTEDYAWEMTTDALIHSWDLARGIGADESLDAELVELVYERTRPVAEHLQETGLFAPPVPVPDDAPLATKLLALFGRRA